MGIMYETVKRLYLEGRIAEAGLDNAISRGWITADDKEAIMATKV